MSIEDIYTEYSTRILSTGYITLLYLDEGVIHIGLNPGDKFDEQKQRILEILPEKISVIFKQSKPWMATTLIG
jgi:hypothetical protein